MLSEMNNDKERFVVWLGFGFVFLLIACTFWSSSQRDQEYEDYKKRQITIVKGTVLNADCSFDPQTGVIECGDLIVVYPSSDIVGPDTYDITKSFRYAGTLLSMDKVPQVGTTVLVSWNKNHPETAYLMSIQ